MSRQKDDSTYKKMGFKLFDTGDSIQFDVNYCSLKKKEIDDLCEWLQSRKDCYLGIGGWYKKRG